MDPQGKASGTFTDSGQRLGSDHTVDIELGDLDNDGDLDIFATNSGNLDRVWFNQSSKPMNASDRFAPTEVHCFGVHACFDEDRDRAWIDVAG